MTISTSGNVGIGTTSPTRTLTVVNTAEQLRIAYDGTVYTDFRNDSAGGLLINTSGGYIINYIGGSEKMRILSNGNVLINTTTDSGNKLEVNGTARFGSVIVGSLGTGTVYSNGGTLTNTNPSDYRLKNTIKPLTYGLNEVMQLNPKSFYYNDNATNLKYGFIAQEVKEVMPELARKLDENSEYLGLETEGIFVTLVNAVKELKAELDLIKNK
jgi:hypothetical protein